MISTLSSDWVCRDAGFEHSDYIWFSQNRDVREREEYEEEYEDFESVKLWKLCDEKVDWKGVDWRGVDGRGADWRVNGEGCENVNHCSATDVYEAERADVSDNEKVREEDEEKCFC